MKKIILPKISKYYYELSRLFAEESYITNVVSYHKRNQKNPEKIKNDILHGKCAEFMVYNYYKLKDTKITFPDIDIYQNRDKSYAADMIVNEKHNLHVKSKYYDERFPNNSWVFQKNDFLVCKPKENDFVALCILAKKESYMYVCRATEIVYEKLDLQHLQDTKVCVYEKTLIS